jgi:hypothetical protein
MGDTQIVCRIETSAGLISRQTEQPWPKGIEFREDECAGAAVVDLTEELVQRNTGALGVPEGDY